MGERVEVLYFGTERPRINSFGSLWGVVLAVGVLGGVFTGFGILLHWHAGRKGGVRS